jgi:hypothetical protein
MFLTVTTGGDQVEAESDCISGLSPSGGAYEASF